MLKSAGLTINYAPPGLTGCGAAISGSLACPVEECKAQVMELAQRVERVELLLFHAPGASFVELDQFISGILSEGCDKGRDEDH